MLPRTSRIVLSTSLLAAFTLACPVPADAQPPALFCSASASPPQLRSEGFTELVGDILLTCTGGTPTPAGVAIPMVNITVFFNTNVTSRLFPFTFTEAVLLIAEPGTPSNPNQLACASPQGCTVFGTSVGGQPGPEPFDGSPGRPNVFPGKKPPFGENSILFQVPLDPPGPATRIYRFKNFRINAMSFPPPGPLPAVALTFISVPGVPVINPQQIIGFIDNGLHFDVRCSTPNASPFTAATLQFTEIFSTSFKTRTSALPSGINTSPPPALQNDPNVNYQSESGFYNPSLLGPGSFFSSAGLADFGTRLMTRFTNIPEGAEIWVTATNLDLKTKQQARLVNTSFFGEGAFSPAPAPFGIAKLPVVGGVATAVWEILAADSQSVQSYTFAVIAKQQLPKTSVLAVSGSFAPAYPLTGFTDRASAVLPIPRFATVLSAGSFCAATP
jgi:hypothetical protein